MKDYYGHNSEFALFMYIFTMHVSVKIVHVYVSVVVYVGNMAL